MPYKEHSCNFLLVHWRGASPRNDIAHHVMHMFIKFNNVVQLEMEDGVLALTH